MSHLPTPCRYACLTLLFCVATTCVVRGHDESRRRALQQQRLAQQRALALAEPLADKSRPVCRLRIRLTDGGADPKPLPAMIRLTNLATGKALQLPSEIHRELNWYSVPADLTISVPAVHIRVSAVHGIETELATKDVDLTGRQEAEVTLQLQQFYDPSHQRLVGGNTHLHLMKLSHVEAIRYLQTVPSSDGLDLLFVSHLRRLPDERDYITNQIVENSLQGGELQRLSQNGVVFGNGEEHRHNFGKGGEGFGHVMLLDLVKLIQPVSIGPGIMGEGTDSQPLQKGILEARSDGATVIWCHNTFGYEDIPNWAAGLLHAQNIFDGGDHGSYADTYYRYLNIGMRVPFSTGTDWFIYDFSRVYVPLAEPLTSRRWLQALRDGRSYITNGTFLEFTVDDQGPGATIRRAGASELRIRARGIGRNDFRALEVIHNGNVVRAQTTRAKGGHFVAELDWLLPMEQPGWLAVRTPLDAGRNEFDKPLFAHTSPVYVEVAGKQIFQPDVARALIAEIEAGVESIDKMAKFANAAERESVLRVHAQGIELLRQRIDQHR